MRCKLFQPASERENRPDTRTVLNGTVLYDGRQGEGGRTFAFPRFGELSSEATRRATIRFACCFNPIASTKIGWSILTLAACGLSPVDSLMLLPGAFESPTSTINLL